MPDDQDSGRGAGVWALLAVLCLGVAGPASAQHFRGYAQVQYQKLENGPSLDPAFDREYWATAFQLDYATRLGRALDVNAQVQLAKLDYTGRPEGNKVPFGSLRLTHANFGVTGFYRLQEQTDVLGVMSRQKQAVLTGYLTHPKWPRLDASWIHRRLDPYAKAPGSTGLNRTVSLSHDIGTLGFRGGYADLVQNPDDTRTRNIRQRTWSAGSSYLYTKGAKLVSAQYDFSDNRRSGAGPTDGARTHDISVGAGKRFSKRTNLNLNYAIRRTNVTGSVRERLDDNNGSLLLSYSPSRPFTFATGGGVRTARTGDGQSSEEYAVVSAGASGPVRHGWTGSANATHSINWSEEGRPRRVDTFGTRTAMRLWTGMDVTGGIAATINDRLRIAPGDSIARPQLGRIVTQTNAGANATPLRGITLGYGYSLYRAGESLTGRANASNTQAWTALWSPARNIRIDGNRSSSKGLGPSGQRFVTSRANAQWDVSSTLQLSGSYTQSGSPRRASIVQYISARRLVSVRALAALARDLQANVGVNWVDPGTGQAVRQIDASITQRFGG